MSAVRLQMMLSPAKDMNFAPCAAADACGAMTEAAGLAGADSMAAVLAALPKSDLAAVLGVSDTLRDENYDRYATWSTATKRQAIVGYDGQAYSKLDARSLSAADLSWSQNRLLMLSGLWGPLRPLDAIKPYRLEMLCKKLPQPHTKLAAFWKPLATSTLLEGFPADGERVLVNLASDEYTAAVDTKAVSEAGVRVLKVDFFQDGKKAPAVYLKYGRGLVVRYVIQNRVDTVDALKRFDLEGYSFDAAQSLENALVFARAKPPPAEKKPPARKRKAEA